MAKSIALIAMAVLAWTIFADYVHAQDSDPVPSKPPDSTSDVYKRSILNSYYRANGISPTLRAGSTATVLRNVEETLPPSLRSLGNTKKEIDFDKVTKLKYGAIYPFLIGGAVEGLQYFLERRAATDMSIPAKTEPAEGP